MPDHRAGGKSKEGSDPPPKINKALAIQANLLTEKEIMDKMKNEDAGGCSMSENRLPAMRSTDLPTRTYPP